MKETLEDKLRRLYDVVDQIEQESTAYAERLRNRIGDVVLQFTEELKEISETLSK